MGNEKRMAAVGFEPTPPKRLVPKTSALDHSATLPRRTLNENHVHELQFIIFVFLIITVKI